MGYRYLELRVHGIHLSPNLAGVGGNSKKLLAFQVRHSSDLSENQRDTPAEVLTRSRLYSGCPGEDL